MSKKLVTSYTFDASAKTIVSADFTSLEKIQLITNVTDNIIIYNFASSAKGGTLSGTTLTLTYDTTLMDDADKLQIFVDEASLIPGTGATNLGKAEDAAHTSGDTGVMALAVRGDSEASLAGSNGDYSPLITDSTGKLRTSASGTVAHDATDAGNPLKIGGKALSSAPADVSASGDRVDAYFDMKGRLKVDASDVAVPVTDNGGSLTVDASSLPLPTGASTAAKQPALGTAGTASSDVITVQGIASMTALKVDGSATTQPVSGSVTANAGTDLNTSALALESGGNLATVASAVKAEDVASADGDKGIPAMAVRKATPANTSGTDGDYENLQMSAGRLWVSSTVDAALPAGTNNIGDVDVVSSALPTGAATAALQTQPGVDIGDVTVNNASGAAAVNIQDGGNSITIDGSVTASGDKTNNSAAPSTDNVGVLPALVNASSPSFTEGNQALLSINTTGNLRTTVNQIAGVAISAGNGTSGTGVQRVTIASDSTGNIATIGTSVTPGTGAANLGKAEDGAHTTGDTGVFALSVRNDTPNATLAANNDYQQVSTDMVGGVRTALYETDFAVLGTSHVKKYYTNTGAVTDGIVWSPAAGKRWYVTDIFINISAAATVTLEDDLAAGDSVVWKAELAANSGWSHSFATPLFSGEDAADLMITTSAGNVYVMCTGYEI